MRAFPGFFYIRGIWPSVCFSSSVSCHSLIVLYCVGGVMPSSISCIIQARRCSVFFMLFNLLVTLLLNM